MSYDIKLHLLHQYDRLETPDLLVAKDLYPRTMIRLGQNYSVLGQIIDLSEYQDERSDIPAEPSIPTQPLPDGVTIYIDGSENTPAIRTDAYGNDLLWATAEDLAAIEIAGKVDSFGYNQAAKAYLGAISGKTSVVIEVR